MTITYSVTDSVAFLKLNRADVANAIDLDTARALRRAVDELTADSDVKAVCITGEGSRFCAGGDVASMTAARDRPAYLRELADVLDSALQKLDCLDRPVIAAVQGSVAGAGLSIMLTCDVVVAARQTKFVMAYPAVGLTPDCGISWLLPRVVGQQRALEFALTGRILSAEDAHQWGLVTEVVDDEPQPRAEKLAVHLAAGPAFAHGQARRLIRSAWTVSRGEAGQSESETIAKAVATEDAQALLGSFGRR